MCSDYKRFCTCRTRDGRWLISLISVSIVWVGGGTAIVFLSTLGVITIPFFWILGLFMMVSTLGCYCLMHCICYGIHAAKPNPCMPHMDVDV